MPRGDAADAEEHRLLATPERVYADRLQSAVLLLFGDEAIAASIRRFATVVEVAAGATLFRQGSAGFRTKKGRGNGAASTTLRAR